MVNPRKSILIGSVMVLALALCCVMLSQTVAAGDSSSKRGTRGGETVLNQVQEDYASVPGVMASRVPIQQMEVGKVMETEVYKDILAPNLSSSLPPKPDIAFRPPHVAPAFKQGGDDITSATVIGALPYTDVGSTAAYNDDYNEVCSYTATGGPDVVYKYDATATQTVDLSLCNSTYDTKLYIYENTYTPGAPYACNDDACPGYMSELLNIIFTAGNTYYIVVDGYNSTEYGDYQLDITLADVVEGPDCPASAIVETEPCVTGADDTYNGGCNSDPNLYDAMACGDTVCGTVWADSDLRDTDWYAFTITETSEISIGAVGNYDIAIGIGYTDGTCDVAAFASADPGDTAVATAVLGAGTYCLVVTASVYEGYPCEAGTWAYTAWADCEEVIALENDFCDGAIAVGDVDMMAWSTATAVPSGFGSYITSPDVFYCYTATCDGVATFSLCGTDWDTRIAVYDGCGCVAPVEAGTDDDGCDTGEEGGSTLASKLIIPVVAGNEYLVQVGGYQSNSGDGVLSISCEIVDELENDDCVDATPIGDVTDLAWSTLTATSSGIGTYIASPDVFYCYTASCDGVVTVSLCGSDFDTRVSVYDGCGCVDPVEITNDDDDCETGENGGSGLASKASFVATAGSEYLIQCGGYGTATGDGLLTVSCVPPPPNDNCEDVTPVELTSGVTEVLNGTSLGATVDCTLLGIPEVWEAFTITECMDVTLELCGTDPYFDAVYILLSNDCPCSGEFTYTCDYDWVSCGDDNPTLRWYGLGPGTYYYAIPDYPAGHSSGPYTLSITGTSAECEPYCCGGGGCDEFIEQVTVGTIDNISDCEGYGDFTGISTTMYTLIGYDIEVVNGNGYSSDECGVWVDWNQDGDFDDADEAITMAGSPGYGPYTGTITPPAGALVGETRMRVDLTYNLTPDPCGVDDYGEVEDYTIVVEDWTCGDCNGDDVVDMNDIVCMEDFYFFMGATMAPLQAGDANCDGYVNIGDIVFISDYLYRSGPAPCCIP